jgi:Ca-activated chloride channel homolog
VTFFEHTSFFYLFLLIPVLAGFFVLSRYLRSKALQRFGDLQLTNSLMPRKSENRPWVKFILLMLALSCLIMAAVNPMMGSRLQEAKQEGVDIIIALDVSRSMLAEDIQPNRLERAKLAVARLVDRLEQDRAGLIIFAGHAITQVPLTSDHHALRMILRTVNTNSVQVQGTAIGTAIERAGMAFRNEQGKSRILIIISDGENHLDDPVEAARQAKSEGIVIHTVGIGTPEGAPIPVYRNGQLSGFLRDQDGNTVVSRYDRASLEQIAHVTGGLFRHGAGADLGLNAILNEIRAAEKDTFERVVFTDYESRYHYFVALALAFLLAELLIANRKNKWMDKIRLFHTN